MSPFSIWPAGFQALRGDDQPPAVRLGRATPVSH